jgi:hypothetical protein
MYLQKLALFAIVSANLGCNWGDVDCTLSEDPGINVEVRDSVTDVVLRRGYTVVVSEGAYRDSTTIPSDGPEYPWGVQSAWERPGVYRVAVRASGYREWVRTGVRVRAGECHVRRVDLVARLQSE